MTEVVDDKDSEKVGNRRVHMANERTFLAWIRTSIGIMAFGFVIEKFALFVKQMSFIVEKSANEDTIPLSHGYSPIIGVFLISLGTLLVLLAFIRYKKVARQIDNDTFKTSSIHEIIITVSILTVGIFLVTYLIQNI